jgi:6-phosphofructokinase 1
MINQASLNVTQLGTCNIPSPLKRKGKTRFVAESARVVYNTEIDLESAANPGLLLERAGAREQIFFDPDKTTVAIVTCGGLSPGLNNVIRSVFLELRHNYGVQRVLGIRNGYMGLNPELGYAPIELTPALVEQINDLGGTMLGTSRGPQDPAVMADFLISHDIDVLFTVGGDGTQRGADALSNEITRRGLQKAIVGIPKTIDNDIAFVEMTFGYATALEQGAEVVRRAHVEARAVPNGIGLVKVMGRDAGFVAAGAAVASQEANFVLVPEVEFPLEGENGFLTALEHRIRDRGHAVIVVSEGAGQHLIPQDELVRDQSGNVKHADIGSFLGDRIKQHFTDCHVPMYLRYIDPSYAIRSVPANAWDRYLSDRMARNAVHAAMAGKSDLVIGVWANRITHVPIDAVVSQKKHMSLNSDLWNAVLATTGQPRWEEHAQAGP